MSKQEKVSALMDSEAIDLAILAELEQEPQAQQTWQNYHLIGDVMRGDTPSAIGINIADRVAQALENEPCHSKLASESFATDALPLQSQPSIAEGRRYLPKWLNPLGQVAIAASVCFAVLLGVQGYSTQDSLTASTMPVLQTVPVLGTVEPVSLSREDLTVPSQTADAQVLQQAQLNEQRQRIYTIFQDYELQLRFNEALNNQEMDQTIQ